MRYIHVRVFYREKEHLIIKVNEEMWRPHQSLFQLAYEDGDNSPLSKEADILLDENRINFKWLRIKRRKKTFIRSGLLKVLEGHTNEINGTKVLEDGRILSYSIDNTLRLWSSQGEPLACLKRPYGKCT